MAKLLKMLSMHIILLGWHLTSFGVSAEHTNGNNHTETSLLDKFQQHDYKLDFERVELGRFDKRYVHFYHFVTFKHNRTCPLLNVTLMYNIDVGYSLEAIVQGYKFASNEYRIFPVRFQANVCEALNKDAIGTKNFDKCGNFTGCPFRKGQVYNICNWSPNPAKFPPFIPSGQYMTEVQVIYRSVELFVVRSYATVSRPIIIPK